MKEVVLQAATAAQCLRLPVQLKHLKFVQLILYLLPLDYWAEFDLEWTERSHPYNILLQQELVGRLKSGLPKER